MYRTEEWLEKLKGKKLKTPITVPSYHRPDAKIFNSNISKALSKDEFFVCIRNDKKEIESYKWLEEQNIATLVLLDGVTDLGDTRGAIVQEFYNRGYENIFMLDDTVTDIMINAPHKSKTGKTYMGTAKWTDTYSAFLIWEYLHNEYKASFEDDSEKGATLSGPGCYKGYEWQPDFIDTPMEINNKQCSNFICLNIKRIIDNNINYQAIAKVGVEDVCIMYNIMKSGLTIRGFTDLTGVMFNTQKTILRGGWGCTRRK